MTDAGAPASTNPKTAALSLVLLVAIITGLFSAVVFDFEIQIGQVRQQTKKDTGKYANSSPLARAHFIEKSQQPVSKAAYRCAVG